MQPVATNQETPQQTIARLQAELAQAKANARPAAQEISLSPKGYIMVKPKGYKGWPVTFTPSAFTYIVNNQGKIQEFIAKNATEIAARGGAL